MVGLKPSYGMISRCDIGPLTRILLRRPLYVLTSCRHGVIAYADSLDCVGVLGKDIASVEAVYSEFPSLNASLSYLASPPQIPHFV